MVKVFLRVSLLPLLVAYVANTLASQSESARTLRVQAERHLQTLIAREDPTLRAQIEIGPIDSRLRLAPCKEVIWFLPRGARLQGTGSIGARCEETSEPWTLYLTYKISLYGPALVAKRPLAMRQELTPGDVELKEVAYDAPAGEYLRDPARLKGAITARPIPTGQPITLDRLLQHPTVRAGQRVKLWLQGNGFYITQEGVALNNAQAGDTVRVRLDSGRLIHGVATRDGKVQVTP